jgi:formylglycine-generating enzyme required for sulfatase activity
MKIPFIIIAFFLLSVQVKLPKSIKRNFTFVPSGNVILEGDSLTIQSFYMQRYEVTNGEYQTFLNWLKENGTKEEQNHAKIKNQNWTNELGISMTEISKHYHLHEAYKNYPVVNVSHQAALMYCSYLEQKINKELKGGEVKVRLPFHAEFIRAGAGDNLKANYAWRDQHMRQPTGEFRANFIRIPQSSLTKDQNGNIVIQKNEVNDSLGSNDLTAPSKSYLEYSYGFYNLNGNVAEMIDEAGTAVGGSFSNYGYDVRLQSSLTYDHISCKVGFRPVFTFVR